MQQELAGVSGAVLAGGTGTRLRPAVAELPKVLAPVGGRPWLMYLLDHLAGAGLRDVVLLTGYRAGQVRAALGDSCCRLRLRHAREPRPLGTAGALRYALDGLHSPRVLVLNGDSFIDADLASFHDLHCERDADASMVLASV